MGKQTISYERSCHFNILQAQGSPVASYGAQEAIVRIAGYAALGSDGGGVEEESEDIEVLEIPFQQALQMIETGEIKDGKTIMLLQYAQIHNLI